MLTSFITEHKTKPRFSKQLSWAASLPHAASEAHNSQSQDSFTPRFLLHSKEKLGEICDGPTPTKPMKTPNLAETHSTACCFPPCLKGNSIWFSPGSSEASATISVPLSNPRSPHTHTDKEATKGVWGILHLGKKRSLFYNRLTRKPNTLNTSYH